MNVECPNCGEVFDPEEEQEPVLTTATMTYEQITVPVIDGVATLPDGTRVQSSAKVLKMVRPR